MLAVLAGLYTGSIERKPEVIVFVESTGNLSPEPVRAGGGGGESVAVVKKPGGTSSGALKENTPAVPGSGGVKEGSRNILLAKEKSMLDKLDQTVSNVAFNGRGDLSDRPSTDFKSVGVGGYGGQGTGSGPGGRGGGSGSGSGSGKDGGGSTLAAGEKIKPSVGASQVKVTSGRRSESEILGILNKYRKGFEFIYVEERKKDPSLSGRVSIQFVIDSKGSIISSDVVDTEITRKEFLAKVLRLLNSIKFPPTEFGDTGVKLPLVFLAP